MSNLENLLQKLIEEKRIARENTDSESEAFAKKFIENRTNVKLAALKNSSLLCYGMFNQQFKDESNTEPY